MSKVGATTKKKKKPLNRYKWACLCVCDVCELYHVREGESNFFPFDNYYPSLFCVCLALFGLFDGWVSGRAGHLLGHI